MLGVIVDLDVLMISIVIGLGEGVMLEIIIEMVMLIIEL